MIQHITKHISNGTFCSSLYELTVDSWISMSTMFVFTIQRIMLRSILSSAVRNCPFYNHLFSKQAFKLEDFPILSKDSIRKDYNAFISKNKEKYDYQIGYTGGSTGEPFQLYITRMPAIFDKRRWKVYGYKKNDIILALDGTKLPDKAVKEKQFLYKKNPHDVPFGSYGLSSLYFNDQTAPLYCEEIRQLKPSFLRGYPSFVYSIANYAEQHNIHLGTSIRGIELTSETAFNYQIEKIKKVFGYSHEVKIYLQYGHTESCVCAYTYDDSYRYRVEPLYGYVEVVNPNGEHVQEGETGEVVVTTLHNRVLPLIRYRTGDFAEYGGKDKRFIYLNKVIGRTQDFIIDRNGNKVLLTALIFAQHFKALGHIKKWQIEQYEQGTVNINIVPTPDWSKEDEDEISTLFENAGNVECKFYFPVNILLTPRGKSQMLIQHLNI